jgi:hypothetical protein
MKRLITQTGPDGKSEFVSESESTRVIRLTSFPSVPKMEIMWGTCGQKRVPFDAVDVSETMSFVPTPGDSRFFVNVTFPDEWTASFSAEKRAAQFEEYISNFPEFRSAFDPKRPGMHRTNTIEYGYVISGKVYLELDGEERRLLTAGDCWINNAAMHAWRNPFDEPCVTVITMFGVD